MKNDPLKKAAHEPVDRLLQEEWRPRPHYPDPFEQCLLALVFLFAIVAAAAGLWQGAAS